MQPQLKQLIMSLKYKTMGTSELQLATKLATNVSRQFFNKEFMQPALEMKLLEMTIPESPRHPRQKYRLSDLGVGVLQIISGVTKSNNR